MRKIEYETAAPTFIGVRDSAIVLPEEDPREALVQAAIQEIATEVEITAGGVTLHLAAWMDPEHWASDWREQIGEKDPDDFVAGLVTEE